MRAAILAGGRGTRLLPYTTVLPKPLVPVGERPILELILHQLGAAGFTAVDLCVGHLGELIRAYFTEAEGAAGGLDLRYVYEEEPLGTAGAIRMLDRLEGPLLVMNGDILSDIDYRELVDYHLETDADLTIASHSRKVDIDLGIIEGEDGVVTGYVEKPTLSYEVSMGIYVYSAAAVEAIPDRRFDLPDLVWELLERGGNVRKFKFGGSWFDIGTAGQLELATAAFERDPELFEPTT